ncbi:EAL domain-containing protein [Cellulomonas sp. URHE0023]|uniref:EAL domain-containing response regulator n=1 Tax=Cellulomonas sp. URHE0023 TaxID=1380354 RepID=UPI0005517336|nr:EAL domain-containing protein [Cellulomonas sp. URHE0023]
MPVRSLERYSTMVVLVVDDSRSNLDRVREFLIEQGMERIVTETDARRVRTLLPEVRPDLVLLDLHMPEVDGYEVLAQVQAYAAGSYLPVLVLTADTSTAARDRVLGLGAQDFLTKPLDVTETRLRIANLLQTRELYSTLRSSVQERQQPEPADDEGDGGTRRRIERALHNGTRDIVYQPVVDIQSLSVVGHEALARFSDPGHGGPERWFADAFSVGLGIEMEWAAAVAALGYLERSPAPLFLAVNMSPATALHMLDRDLFTPEMASRMVIELTEHVPVEDYSAVRGAFAGLRMQGARLSADDLGAGYAGFRHLVRLRPDIIKLDISLISGIHGSMEKRALTRSMVSFAQEVGAQLIAEGVEEPEELAALQELGVPWAQGYLLGRPAPLTAVAAVR